MEASIEKIRSVMSGVKAPQHYDKVFKDECVFSFDTPFSEGGLAVNLKTWQGLGADMVSLDLQRNGGTGLYLVHKYKRVEKKQADAPEPTKLEDLLQEKFETLKEYSVLAIDSTGSKTTVPFPCEDLPMIVTTACQAVIDHKGPSVMDAVDGLDVDDIKESKYCKDLVQLPAFKISPNPKDWKCAKTGDTQNLWLNLSDGYIGSGRRQWDGTGGSNGALDHFEEERAKGNFYPLVVKLGTITPQGADVYSYSPDENDLVKDSLLGQHLAHWGIDIMKMEKFESSMAEMQVEYNMKFDFSKISESGQELVLVRGPGQVGLKNLGNSCYMNSSVQLLMALPEVKQRYLDTDTQIRRSSPSEAAMDLVGQVAKLVNGLNTERYAPPLKDGDDQDDPKVVVAPQMFRSLIGRGHPEFSSGRQQDAAEFVQYLLEQLSRAERTALGSRLSGSTRPTANLFEFQVEERLQETGGEGRVKYTKLQQNMLGLPVKLDDAENLAEVTAFKEAAAKEKEAKKAKTEGEEGEPEEPKPVIQLKSCLDRMAAAEDGLSFRGGTASKTSRLATMPRYLLVQLQRYYVDEKWVPNKLDCKVPMPDTLNLEHLRGRGLQPGEVELPEDTSTSAPSAPAATSPQPDETVVAQLLSMGLNENAAKRASIAVGSAGAEAAASWYFEHMEDPGINDPLEESSSGGGGGGGSGEAATDPEAVAMLCSMGFAEIHVAAALKSCMNSAERAADWLFSHSDDLDGAVAALGGSGGGGGAAASTDFDDGVGEYSLVGFVSHIGKNTGHGHYVCHMKRGVDGGWIIFDDSKVAKSKEPPLDLGYIYLYRRKDTSSGGYGT